MARKREEKSQAERNAERVARAAERARREHVRLEAERRDALARAALAGAKKNSRNPDEAIRRIFAGTLSDREIGAPHLQAVFAAWVQTRRQPVLMQGLLSLLLHAVKVSDLVDPRGQETPRFVDALLSIAEHQGSWIRPPEDWKPPTHNPRRQLCSLTRHLFTRYPVPPFFDGVWFGGRTQEMLRRQCWFIHVGQGKNIRTADVPIPMTRSMAHHFLQTPNDFSVAGALRWAQVRALGGGEQLARALAATRLGEEFDHEEFWSTVIQFFVTNTMLDTAHVGPIVDFIRAQKFAENAPEPEFTMRGRTAVTLLRRVEVWHAELNLQNRRRKYALEKNWKSAGFRGIRFDEVVAGHKRTWETVELLDIDQLDDEGKAMHHCVGSYHSSCASGRVSIWSLRRYDPTGRWRILTVEIDNAARRIVQARGILNRPTDVDALGVLKRWAEVSKLSIGSYL